MFTKEKCPITFRKVQESALKKGNCNCCDRFFNHVFVGCNKGDQIGRIFAYWPLCIFFEKYKSSTNFWLLFSKVLLRFNFNKKWVGPPLGRFISNSSGHPGCNGYLQQPSFTANMYWVEFEIAIFFFLRFFLPLNRIML
jgi:hypothetical protein